MPLGWAPIVTRVVRTGQIVARPRIVRYPRPVVAGPQSCLLAIGRLIGAANLARQPSWVTGQHVVADGGLTLRIGY